MGQADAMAEEMTHTPTADAQVGYSPGEKNGICAASWSISIEKEGASMSTQAVGPDPPVGVAAKPWADASSEARSVAEYIMVGCGLLRTREVLVRGLMWAVQPMVSLG